MDANFDGWISIRTTGLDLEEGGIGRKCYIDRHQKNMDGWMDDWIPKMAEWSTDG